jgi:hypothetical protein
MGTRGYIVKLNQIILFQLAATPENEGSNDDNKGTKEVREEESPKQKSRDR